MQWIDEVGKFVRANHDRNPTAEGDEVWMGHVKRPTVRQVKRERAETVGSESAKFFDVHREHTVQVEEQSVKSVHGNANANPRPVRGHQGGLCAIVGDAHAPTVSRISNHRVRYLPLSFPLLTIER